MSVMERGAAALTVCSIPVRIAALVPSMEVVSGPGRQLTAVARALQCAGVPCLVVVLHRRGRPSPAFTRYLEDAGIEYSVVEDRGPLDWRLSSTVGTVLRRWGPSIVQTHGYKASAVAYLLRKQGVPWSWVGFFHGTTTENLKDRLYHWLDRLLLSAAERIVVMSQVQARRFGHVSSRVRTIYNAALDPPPSGDGRSDRERVAAAAGSLRRPILGVVGRLSLEKGVDLFLDACASLVRKGSVFSALVAGDGPERARLEAQCRRLGLASCVRFLGHVGTIHVVYQNIDLLVLPSRSEGLPNALLEAMQADVPVVATTVGAVPEVVGTSAAARLVPPGSVAALADAIERGVTQGDSIEAAAARRNAVSRFSLERRVEAHLQLYRELLEEK